MTLRRTEVPPPHPGCLYCMKRWRRLNEEFLFEDEVEKSVKCVAYYESHGYVHLPHIMPSTEQFQFSEPCGPNCSKRTR